MILFISCDDMGPKPYIIECKCIKEGEPYAIQGYHCGQVGCPVCIRRDCLKYKCDTIWLKSHNAPFPLKSK